MSERISPETLMQVTVKGDFDGFAIMNVHTVVITNQFDFVDGRDAGAEGIVFSTHFRGRGEFRTLLERLKLVQGVTHVEYKPTPRAQA